MRLCHFLKNDQLHVGAYSEGEVLDLTALARDAGGAVPRQALDLLGPDPQALALHKELEAKAKGLSASDRKKYTQRTGELTLRSPILRPNKFFLLAGNYNEHITEGGGRAVLKKETFPYVFMKPASTAINHPGSPVYLPKSSPDHMDWEIELAVVIGRDCKYITADQAPDCIAGYTIVNDISDRRFRPNPSRKEREKDSFFDWMHGKWHDGGAPIGPCITPAAEIGDPGNLDLRLKVSGEVEQDSNTSKMIFSAYDVVEFLASWITLERGDIISTGTAAGVGSGKGKFLREGDVIEATIEKIGTLTNPVRAEA